MDVDTIIAGLSEAQKAMLVRPNGTYRDNLRDVAELIDSQIWGTTFTPLGLAVRARLLGEG